MAEKENGREYSRLQPNLVVDHRDRQIADLNERIEQIASMISNPSTHRLTDPFPFCSPWQVKIASLDTVKSNPVAWTLYCRDWVEGKRDTKAIPEVERPPHMSHINGARPLMATHTVTRAASFTQPLLPQSVQPLISPINQENTSWLVSKTVVTNLTPVNQGASTSTVLANNPTTMTLASQSILKRKAKSPSKLRKDRIKLQAFKQKNK
ncbi:uncharacterized protein LOC126839225 [Adelges cooleyi]|uniref:uncharacterized protein LOC126839225 n=1 Tax=Adelges cooleyi TaxID=133065 RepID=UPI0021801472|nr:uncharacterized protein LOC126839225 [Adelges cooleyi]XP_050430338.1 uncharacterized protein LOC126839225 [Adelges cooleyi]